MGKEHNQQSEKKEPQSGGSQPQTRKSSVSKDVNITKYLDSRAAELAHFEAVLQNKFKESTRTPMQTVPKHMRRRAMSHNRFRIPSRIRALNAKYMKDSEKKILRNRKHARNNKLILLHYFKRGFRANLEEPGVAADQGMNNELEETEQLGLPKFLRCRWLETHLWHARRMAMMEYCGCKIAQFSRQKAMKRSRVGALAGLSAYDHSYLAVVQVAQLKNPSRLIQTLCLQILRGSWETGVLEVRIDPEIGHATLIKSSSSSFVILADPSVQSHLTARIRNILGTQPDESSATILNLNDLVNIFELFGPQSLRLIMKSMKSDIQGLPEHAKGYDGLSLVPTHLSFGPIGTLKCQYFRDCKQRDITHKTSVGVAGQEMIDEKEEPPVAEDWSLEDNLAFGKWMKDSSDLEGFWNASQQETEMENIMARFFESRRGQYSHKRTKFVPETEAISSPSKAPTNTTPKPKKIAVTAPSKMKPEEVSSTSLKQKLAQIKNKEFQILLINVSIRAQQINKVLVIVPSGFGLRLWRRLNQFGARALGFKEYIHVTHQLGQRAYPMDFPQSLQFKQYEKDNQDRLQNKYFRRPPAKRTNHLRTNCPFPFSFKLQELGSPYEQKSYVQCRIRPLNGGVPQERSYVCFPLEADFQRLLKSFEVHGKNNSSTILDRVLNDQSMELTEPVETRDETNAPLSNPHRNRTEYLEQIEAKGYTGPSRQVIGRVTSGFLDNKSAKGLGFASVLESELSGLSQISATLRTLKSAKYLNLPSDCSLALFRNPNSIHYFFCLVSQE